VCPKCVMAKARKGGHDPTSSQKATGGKHINIYMLSIVVVVSTGSAGKRGLWSNRFTRFLDHTQRRATEGMTPLDE
jgi:hypothetical protein